MFFLLLLFIAFVAIRVMTIPYTAPAIHAEASALGTEMKSVEDGGKRAV